MEEFVSMVRLYCGILAGNNLSLWVRAFLSCLALGMFVDARDASGKCAFCLVGCLEGVERVNLVACLGWVKPRRSWNLNSAAGLPGVAGKFLVFCMAMCSLCCKPMVWKLWYDSPQSNVVFSRLSCIFAEWPMDQCVGVLCGVYPQLCPVHRGCVHMGCICLRDWKNSCFWALWFTASILDLARISDGGALKALRFVSNGGGALKALRFALVE